MAKKHSKKQARPSEVPAGMWGGVVATLKFVFKNVRLFLPLLVVALVICGAAMWVSDDAMVIVVVMAMLVLWLATLFFARRVMAGEKVKFRDGLYNAMTPLVSSLIVFVVLAVQCIPVMLIVIGYSAAVETNLFANVFYGSLFVLFAILMVVIAGFLLSGTLMGMIAVNTPGMYPWEALKLSHELMIGRRVEFVLKMLVLLMLLAVVYVVIVGPAVLVGLMLYNIGGIETPMLVPIVSTVAGCVAVILAGVYLYIYYRQILGMKVRI